MSFICYFLFSDSLSLCFSLPLLSSSISLFDYFLVLSPLCIGTYNVLVLLLLLLFLLLLNRYHSLLIPPSPPPFHDYIIRQTNVEKRQRYPTACVSELSSQHTHSLSLHPCPLHITQWHMCMPVLGCASETDIGNSNTHTLNNRNIVPLSVFFLCYSLVSFGTRKRMILGYYVFIDCLLLWNKIIIYYCLFIGFLWADTDLTFSFDSLAKESCKEKAESLVLKTDNVMKVHNKQSLLDNWHNVTWLLDVNSLLIHNCPDKIRNIPKKSWVLSSKEILLQGNNSCLSSKQKHFVATGPFLSNPILLW